MTTSNVTVYELTRNQIIEAAIRKLGRLYSGQVPTAQQYSDAQIALNALVAEYTVLGMSLWARTDLNLPLVAGTNTYTFGIGQTINVPFPLKINSIVLRANGGGVSNMFDLAKDDFMLLSPSSTGVPTNYTYQPMINKGTLTIWPTPTADVISTYTAVMTYNQPFQGFTTGTETPYFPQEWQNALIYGLADALAEEYQVPIMDASRLEKKAAYHLEMALSAGGENSSFYFQPDKTRG